MLGAKLILVLVLGQAKETGLNSDPATLVAQLGAARYVDRQAAAAALERIGGPALPALRSARDSQDMEIRTRAAGLAQRIEGALLTQPTRIRLDFTNTTLSDVSRALSLQTGFHITLSPQNLPRWKYQRITLLQSEPVDFWTAVDRLCDAAGIQYNASMHYSGGEREPTFTLTEGMIRTPTSDHGPFRVSLLGIDYQRQLSYAPTGSAGRFLPQPPRPVPLEREKRAPGETPRIHPVVSVQFIAHLLLAAEPRLSLAHHGALQLKEALDERGNSLIPASAGGRITGIGMPSGPVLPIHVPLHRPAEAGQMIKKLRGVIPLTVSCRRPDPLVVPLDNATGKTFENSDVQLTVHEIRALPTSHNTQVELTVRANDRDASLSHGELEEFSSVFQRANSQHLQIEVLDTRGQLIQWYQSRAEPETSHVTLTLNNLTQTTQPKELRYYTLTRSDVNMPFEFSDIPMP